MGKMKVTYIGIFLDDDSKQILNERAENLPKKPNNMHCTLAFKPTNQQLEIFKKFVGKSVDLIVTGYACDGENCGFKVQLPPELEGCFDKRHLDSREKTPHVTVCMSENADAINTAFLPFKKIDGFTIKGTAGFFAKGRPFFNPDELIIDEPHRELGER